jgi:DnaB-like helicase N terminal domain
MNFFAPERESAVVGYVSVQGFSNLPESCLVSPEDFTDTRWRMIYACALNLHRSGREANHLTINEELPRLKWDTILQKEIGLAGWHNWPAICDTSLAYSPRGLGVIECLKDIRRLAGERRGNEIVKKAAAGEIGVEETIEALQGIKESSRAISVAAILSSRRFDSMNPPQAARPIYEINRQSICTPGNITAISSHIKSGKSAFIGACIAASFGLDGDTLGIDSANLNEHAVIHFDCEQCPADHHALIATALSRVGIEGAPEWLRSYRILDLPTSQRFDLLEHERE